MQREWLLFGSSSLIGLLGVCFLRGELEGAVEGIGDGEKISWEERGQLTLTPPPHNAQGRVACGWGYSLQREKINEARYLMEVD